MNNETAKNGVCIFDCGNTTIRIAGIEFRLTVSKWGGQSFQFSASRSIEAYRDKCMQTMDLIIDNQKRALMESWTKWNERTPQSLQYLYLIVSKTKLLIAVLVVSNPRKSFWEWHFPGCLRTLPPVLVSISLALCWTWAFATARRRLRWKWRWRSGPCWGFPSSACREHVATRRNAAETPLGRGTSVNWDERYLHLSRNSTKSTIAINKWCWIANAEVFKWFFEYLVRYEAGLARVKSPAQKSRGLYSWAFLGFFKWDLKKPTLSQNS